ncbi:MAG: hypothetical protein LBL72_08080 [Candidatus Accumulibacter sp.]|jgi:hypothetical protein|nr:hypothetical protein [Accumulibacter sp.]
MNAILDSPVNAWDTLDALERALFSAQDSKRGGVSIESLARALREEYFSRIIEAASSGKLFESWEKPSAALSLIRELMGVDSGVPGLRGAARRILDVVDEARQRFENAGGEVGPFEDWALPRAYSALKTARAGKEWVDDHLAWVDRSRYLDANASPMGDKALRALFEEIQRAVATRGMSARERAFDAGAPALRGNAARSIWYRDAESFIAALRKYGELDGEAGAAADGNVDGEVGGARFDAFDAVDLIFRHVDAIAREIVLVEHAKHEATRADVGDALRIDRRAETLEALYAGTIDAAVGTPFGVFDSVKDGDAFSGISVLPSFIALPSALEMTPVCNALPFVRAFDEELRTLDASSAADRRLALRAGLGVEYVIGELFRWGADEIDALACVSDRVGKFSRKAATRVLRRSGVRAVIRALRRGFSVCALDALGELSRRVDSFNALDGDERAALEAAGMNEADWAVWRCARTADFRERGDTLLTVKAIYEISDASLENVCERTRRTPQRLRDDAALHLTACLGGAGDGEPRGFTDGGEAFASGARGGARRSRVEAAGVEGSAFALLLVNLTRGMANAQGTGKAGVLAPLTVALTLLGAMALELDEVAQGRRARKTRDTDFWALAFEKSGARALYANFIFGDAPAGDAEGMNGTVDAGDSVELASDAGAADFVPDENLWYRKAAFDHMLFHTLQEYFSPDYLVRGLRTEDRGQNCDLFSVFSGLIGGQRL